MPRYDPTDLTPKISLSVDESWYEKYWLTDRPDPAPARLWHKLWVALVGHAVLCWRLWPSRHRPISRLGPLPAVVRSE